MTPLRKEMIKAMQMRGLSDRTEESYVGSVRDLARFTMRSPDTLTPTEINSYFEYLVI
jgi:hypothetical protein